MGSWRNSRTSSTKLLWLILPFMVVAVFIGVKRSNWIDRSKVQVAAAAEGPVASGLGSAVVDGGGAVAEGPSEGYLFNRSFDSSYPPLAMEEEMDVELPDIAKEDDLNMTLIGPDFFATTNQTRVFSVDRGKKQKIHEFG
ncbi:hypothetical protein R6Q59_027581 [Mikania micrantha]